MKKLCMAFAMTVVIVLTSTAEADIWNGGFISFTKASGADWTLEANQDRITDSVWITRQDRRGIYNIRQESTYTDNFSPLDTEWGFGTTADLGTISFFNWESWTTSNPPTMVGQDAVVHLISDDIYIDIRFTSWGQGANGGEFSYVRATTFVIPEPASFLVVAFLSGWFGFRRVRGDVQ